MWMACTRKLCACLLCELDTSFAESTHLQKKGKTLREEKPECQGLQVFWFLPRESAAPMSAQRPDDDLHLTAPLDSAHHHILLIPAYAHCSACPSSCSVFLWYEPTPWFSAGVNLDERMFIWGGLIKWVALHTSSPCCVGMCLGIWLRIEPIFFQPICTLTSAFCYLPWILITNALFSSNGLPHESPRRWL